MIQYCFVVFVVVVAVVFFGGEGGANRFTQQGHER